LKAEENAARIRATFLKEDVDVVINADETFLLFHPFGQRLIAPTGVKRAGSVVQVDNEKWGGPSHDCLRVPHLMHSTTNDHLHRSVWSQVDEALGRFRPSQGDI